MLGSSRGLRVCAVLSCASWIASCGGSSPPAQQPQAMSAEDRAVLRDPVLDAVVNADAQRRPTHGVPTDHRNDPPQAAAAGGQPTRGSGGVGVRGITGSLTAFEVEEAMQTRNDALMACVQARPNRLGHVAGEIKFHVAIDPTGKAERVRITQSDIGFPQLERCLVDVVASAPFPAPAGHERTETSWQMSVQPLSRGADLVEVTELEDAITRQAEAMYEACTIERDRKFSVTGYLDRRGKLTPLSVLPQWRGPARTPEDPQEQVDCMTQALADWKHWPKPSRFTKATFELRWVKAPEEPRRGRRSKPKKRH